MATKTKTPVPGDFKVKRLQKELKTEAHNWYQLGFQLRIPSDSLKKIESFARRTPQVCFTEVVEYWLKNGENKKWEVIFEALEENYGRLLRNLKQKQIYFPEMEVELGATDLVNLLEEVTPNWFMFGQDLDIPPFILEGFKDSKGVDWCFSGMLNAWLNLGAYWEDLVEALIRIGNRKLANHIENTYIKAIPAPSPGVKPELWYSGLDETLLEEEDYFTVLSSITTVNKWEELGLALKIANHKLDEIRRDKRETAECRKAMLTLWFRDGKSSWKSLCLALDHHLVGEHNLARQLAKKHKGAQQESGPLAKEHATPVMEQDQSQQGKVVGEGGTMVEYRDDSSYIPSVSSPSQTSDSMETESGSQNLQFDNGKNAPTEEEEDNKQGHHSMARAVAQPVRVKTVEEHNSLVFPKPGIDKSRVDHPQNPPINLPSSNTAQVHGGQSCVTGHGPHKVFESTSSIYGDAIPETKGRNS